MNAQIIDYNYADVQSASYECQTRNRLPLSFFQTEPLTLLFCICIIQIIQIKINKLLEGSKISFKTCLGKHLCTCVFIQFCVLVDTLILILLDTL